MAERKGRLELELKLPEKDFSYGIPNRPSTPMKEVVSMSRSSRQCVRQPGRESHSGDLPIEVGSAAERRPAEDEAGDVDDEGDSHEQRGDQYEDTIETGRPFHQTQGCLQNDQI